jgi:hypothetical protein
MDKEKNEFRKVKLNEINKSTSGCMHYKRKAKFVVSGID